MQYQVNALYFVVTVGMLVTGLPLCLAKNSWLEYVILAGFGLFRKVWPSNHSPQYVIFTRLPLFCNFTWVSIGFGTIGNVVDNDRACSDCAPSADFNSGNDCCSCPYR